jgi:DNA polymerase elongation subunit (family B)
MSPEFRKKIKNILFLDLETIASFGSYQELSPRMQQLWDKRAANLRRRSDNELLSDAELYYSQAGISAEFGRIACIAFGGVYFTEHEEPALKVSSFSGDNEFEMLSSFKLLLEKYNQDQLVLCAHNGKEFDFPFLCRRMLVNGIALPRSLQLAGKRPWEILHQDTMELWKFGDYKAHTSLDLLAAIFDIPGSKGEMSGDQVTRVYYEEKDLEKIARYCREDVVVLTQLYLKMHLQPTIKEENITRVVS